MTDELNRLLDSWKAWNERREEIRLDPKSATPEEISRLFDETTGISKFMTTGTFLANHPRVGDFDRIVVETRMVRRDLERYEKIIADFWLQNRWTPVTQFFDEVKELDAILPPELGASLKRLTDGMLAVDYKELADKMSDLAGFHRMLDWTLRSVEDLASKISLEAARAYGQKP